ncbi:MAG: hypothetical protein KTQ49_05095 [Candidatus Omnitrophica bacterium]|nr:hypothetical protein [Candidatus Omnitrophota bacterium]
MTVYEKMYDLKYRKGISTIDLVHQFPKNMRHINEVALLDIPQKVLREVVVEKNVLEHLTALKQRLEKN